MDQNIKAFQTSREFKRIFNSCFNNWKQKNHGTAESLAELCGVSSSYINQIRRYGRIPSKPVLYLLLLSLDSNESELMLDYAGYSRDFELLKILKKRYQQQQNNLFNFSFNEELFQNLILNSLTTKNTNRSKNVVNAAVNKEFYWLLGDAKQSEMFPGFNRLQNLFKLANLDLQLHELSIREAIPAMQNGEIDLLIPFFRTEIRSCSMNFSEPLAKLKIKLLSRLEQLPQNLSELPGKLAVLENSVVHHYSLTELKLEPSQLLLCKTPEQVWDCSEFPTRSSSACGLLVDEFGADITSAAIPVLKTEREFMPEVDWCLGVSNQRADLLPLINSGIQQSTVQELKNFFN